MHFYLGGAISKFDKLNSMIQMEKLTWALYFNQKWVIAFGDQRNS